VFVRIVSAPLTSAWSASTTMNSACWPLAVCSATHGAILFTVVLTAGGPPRPAAPEDPMTASAAIAAPTINNEQNIRRHGNGVPRRFDFVILESPGNVLIFVFIRVAVFL